MRDLRLVNVTCATLVIATACDQDNPTTPLDTRHTITAAKQTVKATKWASLYPSAQLTCGLTTAGRAYCWGLNNYGQLGIGSTDYAVSMPREIAGNHQFSELAVAYKHACGIASGRMYCWGHNDRGQLGNPLTTDMSRVPIEVQGNIDFSHVSVGFSHTCGIGTRLGSSYSNLGYCWGDNQAGQIGNYQFGSGLYEDTPQEIANLSGISNPVTGFPSLKLYWIEGGGLGTCGLSEGTDNNGMPTNKPGSVVCWGYNDHYMFGTTSYNLAPFPSLAMESLSPSSVELSLFNTSACALASNRTSTYTSAYCWGGGGSGETGDGTTEIHSEPTLVSGLAASRFVRISTGSGHSCGITSRGEAYCWGSNTHGQLGTGTLVTSLVPVAVAGGIKFKEIYAAGADPTNTAFTCGLTSKGEAYCWGGNELGQLGDGTTIDRLVPTAVLDPI